METDSPMEPLARALYALDLADFTPAELPDEALLAAREGLAFEVPVPVQPDLELSVAFDPQDEAYVVAVRLTRDPLSEALLLGAMGLNDSLPVAGARFSLEPYTGCIKLADLLPWDEATPDALALLICDLVVLMSRLEDVAAQAPAPETEPERDEAADLLNTYAQSVKA